MDIPLNDVYGAAQELTVSTATPPPSPERRLWLPVLRQAIADLKTARIVGDLALKSVWRIRRIALVVSVAVRSALTITKSWSVMRSRTGDASLAVRGGNESVQSFAGRIAIRGGDSRRLCRVFLSASYLVGDRPVIAAITGCHKSSKPGTLTSPKTIEILGAES